MSRTARTSLTPRIVQVPARVNAPRAADPAPNYEVRFSRDTTSLEAVKKAAYYFSDRCAFDFSVNGAEIVCKMIFGSILTPDRVRAFEVEFRNEVLDQELRAKIADETAMVRNAVLAYAFSRTGLQSGDEIQGA